MARYLIKGGRLVDPRSKIDKVADVLVDKGLVAGIGSGLKPDGARVIEARGLIVCPGLIDMHVHLREPGREDEETIASGTKAAAAGGFTSVACMANTEPPADSATVIDMIRETAAENGAVRVWTVGAISKRLAGEELAEMADMRQSGAVAFSDDGHGVRDPEVMRRAMEYAMMLDVTLIIHAEDAALAGKGQMNEGYYSTLLGLKPIPAAAEDTMVARDIVLARLTGAKIHFTHVSTKGSVDLVRRAKADGIAVTCDVTPHHLVLTDASLVEYDTNLKVNPPLRSADDAAALKAGLADGTIDAIASDHAPHAPQEKECEFEYAACGMIGLETSVPLIWTHVVGDGVIDVSEAIEKMSVNPARILGLDGQGPGMLDKGSAADITIIDPKAQVEIDTATMRSRSRNTPFGGWRLTGRVVMTFVGGRPVYDAAGEGGA